MVVEYEDETLNTNATLVKDKKVACTKLCIYVMYFAMDTILFVIIRLLLLVANCVSCFLSKILIKTTIFWPNGQFLS